MHLKSMLKKIIYLISIISPMLVLAASKAGEFKSPITSYAVMKMCVGLIIVIIMLYATLYFLKKIQQVKTHNKKGMKIIDGLSLGMRDKLLLIEVNQCQILIAVTPGNIRKIETFKNTQFNEQFQHALTKVPSCEDITA